MLKKIRLGKSPLSIVIEGNPDAVVQLIAHLKKHVKEIETCG